MIIFSCFCLSGNIRLVNGDLSADVYSGRLEIFQNSTWGTVCDDYFSTVDAIVTCKTLGYR